MTLSLKATPGHWDSNSYVTLEYADEYFTVHPQKEYWDAFSETNKKSALIMATRFLDGIPTFAVGLPLYGDVPYDQALKLPLSTHETYTGTADSGSTTTLVDSAFADSDDYRDDYFNDGAIRITSGTAKNSHVDITDFVVSTGTFTTEAFSSAIDNTSKFDAIMPLDRELRNGVCEIALEIARGGLLEAINTQSMVGEAHNIIPASAKQMLSSYFSKGGRLVR